MRFTVRGQSQLSVIRGLAVDICGNVVRKLCHPAGGYTTPVAEPKIAAAAGRSRTVLPAAKFWGSTTFWYSHRVRGTSVPSHETVDSRQGQWRGRKTSNNQAGYEAARSKMRLNGAPLPATSCHRYVQVPNEARMTKNS